MANGEIIVVKDGTKIEVLQAKPFKEALANLEDQEDKLAEYKQDAIKFKGKVVDPVSFAKAGELLAKIKDESDTGERTMDPFRILTNKIKDFIMVRQRRVTNAAEEIRGILTAEMGAYTTKVERDRKAEEEREREKKRLALQREAEEKRVADEAAATENRKKRVAEIRADLRDGKITKRESEKRLREAGANEEADKAKAAADADEATAKAAEVAAKTKVKSEVPKVAGVVQRMNRKFKVVNAQQVKLKYLIPNEVAIGAIARNKELTIEQAQAEVGGIEVWEEPSF